MSEWSRVLVCGGRHFDDAWLLNGWLDHLHKLNTITLLIHGAANGADSLADRWAARRNVLVAACPADWKTHGKAAGPIRNQHMLDEWKPELVLAFPGGRGTADMVMRAARAHVQVLSVRAPQRTQTSSTFAMHGRE